MEKAKKGKRGCGVLIAFLGFTYFSSYLLRYSYGISMSAVREALSLTDSQAGAVLAAFTFAYATGQIVCGVIGDRFAPERLVFFGLLVGVLCNLFFPYCIMAGQAAGIAIWAVCGVSQAMLWPSLVRYMATRLPSEKYGRAVAFVTALAAFANVLMYLLVPQIIKTLSWDWVFVVAPAITTVFMVAWLIVSKVYSKIDLVGSPEGNVAEPIPVRKMEVKKFIGLFISSGIIFIFLGIAAQGFLRDGITDWVPRILSDTFGIDTADSIFMTVAVSIGTAVCAYLFTWIYTKFFKSEVTAATVFFAILATLTAVMFAVFRKHAAVTLVLLVLMVMLAHGINMMLISYVPRRFARYGRAAMASGMTNAFTYVGSGIASSVTGLVSQGSGGWAYVILMWLGMATLGTVILIFASRPWNKFLRNLKK